MLKSITHPFLPTSKCNLNRVPQRIQTMLLATKVCNSKLRIVRLLLRTTTRQTMISGNSKSSASNCTMHSVEPAARGPSQPIAARSWLSEPVILPRISYKPDSKHRMKKASSTNRKDLLLTTTCSLGRCIAMWLNLLQIVFWQSRLILTTLLVTMISNPRPWASVLRILSMKIITLKLSPSRLMIKAAGSSLNRHLSWRIEATHVELRLVNRALRCKKRLNNSNLS